MLGKKGERMMPWQSYIFVPHDSGIFVCVCEMVVVFFPFCPELRTNQPSSWLH